MFSVREASGYGDAFSRWDPHATVSSRAARRAREPAEGEEPAGATQGTERAAAFWVRAEEEEAAVPPVRAWLPARA